MYVSDAEALLAKVRPDSPAQADALRPRPRAPRRRASPRRPDQDLAPAHPPGREGLGDLGHRRLWGRPDPRRHGDRGPGDVRRFANRDAYASYNGTAPVERSSGGRIVHRLSQRGNRKVNHDLHMVAVTQIRNPGTQGRIYFERKVAEGKTKKEALRSLKRHAPTPSIDSLLLDVR